MSSRSKSNGRGSNKNERQDKAPSPEKLAAFLGILLTKPLSTEQVIHLRRPLPGYIPLLQECATLLANKDETLKVRGVTPESLQALKAERQFLADCEHSAEVVYTSNYHQRMLSDDRGIDMLFTIARAVEAEAEVDPGVMGRWGFVVDYVKAFRPGGPRKPSKGKGKNAGNGDTGKTGTEDK